MIEYKVKVDDDGTKRWYLNNELHREDGPAIEFSTGTKEWYLNGKLHREDGPAVERRDGTKEWHLNGAQLTEEEFNKRTNTTTTCNNKVVEIDGKKYKLVEL